MIQCRKEQEKNAGYSRPCPLKSIVVLIFFRNINFFTAFVLALYVGALHAAAISGHLQPAPTVISTGMVYDDLLGGLAGNAFASALAAAILVFFQAIIVNRVADHFRLMEDRNWLPGLGYALVASALPDFQFLSAPLVAATFVPLSLWYVFQTYKSPRSPVLVFDTALWISVAGLFYPAAWYLLPAFFIGVGIMRSWKFSDQLAFFVAVFVPAFLAWIWYFWHGAGEIFRHRHLEGLLHIYRFDETPVTGAWYKGALLVALLLVFILNFGTFLHNKSMQARKSTLILYWVLFTGAVLCLVQAEWHWEVLVLPASAAGILAGMIFRNLRPIVAEVLHGLLLAAVLGMQFFT